MSGLVFSIATGAAATGGLAVSSGGPVVSSGAPVIGAAVASVASLGAPPSVVFISCSFSFIKFTTFCAACFA